MYCKNFDFFLSSEGDEKRIAYETATDAPGDYNEYEYGEDEYEEAMTGPGEDYGQVGSLAHILFTFLATFYQLEIQMSFFLGKTDDLSKVFLLA